MSRPLYHANLIASELERVRRDRLWRGLVVATLVVLVIGLGAAHVGIRRRVSALRHKEERLTLAISRAEPDAKRMRDLRKRHDELTAHSVLVRKCRKTEERWTQFLGAVSAKLPADTWLTEVQSAAHRTDGSSTKPSVSWSPQERTVILAGVSQSPAGVSTYLTRLNYTDWFAAELQLTKMKRTTIGETPVYEFAATGKLRTPLGLTGGPG
jgi:Tfp pilus assembly protein PilN